MRTFVNAFALGLHILIEALVDFVTTQWWVIIPFATLFVFWFAGRIG